jgi:hypothetical protein
MARAVYASHQQQRPEFDHLLQAPLPGEANWPYPLDKVLI